MASLYATTAQPEFIFLTESEVWQALHSENIISAEVQRILSVLQTRFTDYMRETDRENLPPEIMHVAVRCPIERVAVELMVGMRGDREEIRNALSASCSGRFRTS